MSAENIAVINPTFEVEAGELVVQHARLTLNVDGTVKQAGALDNTIGTSNRAVAVADTNRRVSITGVNADGARTMIAVTAITAGDLLGAAAAGKVTTGTGLNMQAWTAAAADGDTLLCLPLMKDSVT